MIPNESGNIDAKTAPNIKSNWVQGKCLPHIPKKSKTGSKVEKARKAEKKLKKSKNRPKKQSSTMRQRVKKSVKHPKIPVNERDKAGLEKVLELLTSSDRSVKKNKRLLEILQRHKHESTDSESSAEIISGELSLLGDLAIQKEGTSGADASSSYSDSYYYTDTYEYYYTKEKLQDIQERIYSTRKSTCGSNPEDADGVANDTIIVPDQVKTEKKTAYCKGGYHPVEIGDVYNDGNYRILRKLGFGFFSTVWLCYDYKHKRCVAIKIAKSGERFAQDARNELEIGKIISANDPDNKFQSKLNLVDDFVIEGPHGSHQAAVFILVGPNLDKWVKQVPDTGLPIPIVRALVREMLRSLDFLHRKARIVHTDLKPDNLCLVIDHHYRRKLAADAIEWQKISDTPPHPSFISSVAEGFDNYATLRRREKIHSLRRKNKRITQLEQIEDDLDNELANITPEHGHWAAKELHQLHPNLMNPNDADKIRVICADLGIAVPRDALYDQQIQIRQFRALEVILGLPPYGAETDIWSAACCAYKFGTGKKLFNPHEEKSWDKRQDHLKLIIEAIGDLPDIYENAKHYKKLYDSNGRPINIYEELHPSPIRERFSHWPKEEAQGFSRLLIRMLHPDPSRRPTARQLLEDPWLIKDKFKHNDDLSSGDDDNVGRETAEEAILRIQQIEMKQKNRIDIDMQLEQIQKKIDVLAKTRKLMPPAKFKEEVKLLEAQYKAIEGVVSEDSYSEYYSSGSLYAYVSDSSSEEEQENPDDYKKGGYHPANVGDLYNNRYHVIRKIGWGVFSTVWLAWDLEEKRFVALKIMVSKKRFADMANQEMIFLKTVRDTDPTNPHREKVVRLYDDFKLRGVNGDHCVMVFETLGPNLDKWLLKSNGGGFPRSCVKKMMIQLLQGIDYMHRVCNIIHTDLKPDNILLKVSTSYIKRLAAEAYDWQQKGLMPTSLSHISSTKAKDICLRSYLKKKKAGQSPEDCPPKLKVDESTNRITGITACDEDDWRNTNLPINELYVDVMDEKQANDIEVKIADLGLACWKNDHEDDGIQARPYRALEVIIDAGFDSPADIWSAGCICFELATGNTLFRAKKQNGWTKVQDHLRNIAKQIGPLPKDIVLAGQRSKELFDSNGKQLEVGEIEYYPIEERMIKEYKWKKYEATQFSNFLLKMLNPDPKKRETAHQLLDDVWLNS